MRIAQSEALVAPDLLHLAVFLNARTFGPQSVRGDTTTNVILKAFCGARSARSNNTTQPTKATLGGGYK